MPEGQKAKTRSAPAYVSMCTALPSLCTLSGDGFRARLWREGSFLWLEHAFWTRGIWLSAVKALRFVFFSAAWPSGLLALSLPVFAHSLWLLLSLSLALLLALWLSASRDQAGEVPGVTPGALFGVPFGCWALTLLGCPHSV